MASIRQTKLEFVKRDAIRRLLKGKELRSSAQFEERLNFEVKALIEKAVDRAWSQRTGKQKRRTLWAQDL